MSSSKSIAPQAAPRPASPNDPHPSDSFIASGDPNNDHYEADDSENGPVGSFLLFAAIPSWLTSMVLHVIALLVLALLTIRIERQMTTELQINKGDNESDVIEVIEPSEMESLDIEAVEPTPFDVPSEVMPEEPTLTNANDLDAAAVSVQLDPLGDFAASTDLIGEFGTTNGSGLEGRGAASKARLLREAGGSEGSEEAVKLALKWFAKHQNRDGSWSFRHLGGTCACPNHGKLGNAYIGATAMAILPYLGAGSTHFEGEYKEQVQAGLYYIMSRQKPNGDLTEPGGTMYSHGIAAICLCEAYAMTQDRKLMKHAQAALDYIAYAQDPIGGGWRYRPHEPGDTSVVGWQLMALKSGHMAYLQVDPNVLRKTTKFLNSVQTDYGSAYGYTSPGNRSATTSIGLLCRMYLGWKKDEEALQKGVERLSRSGRSDVDMYYNYYATQVMRHMEGKHWDKWNGQMRDWLIEKQAKTGHMAGSWHMGASHSVEKGGRLYNTSMATMVLEVYYRHLPIYRQQATEDDFEL